MCIGFPTTRHKGDPAFRVPAIKREHQVPEFIAGAPLHNEEMDKGTSKTISRAPTVLEDGSFDVGLCTVSRFCNALTDEH